MDSISLKPFRHPGFRRMLAACALVLAAASVSAIAQAPSRQPPPRLTFRYAPVPADSAPGGWNLIVRVEVPPGWHINSDAPLDEFLVPTSLEAKADGFGFGKPRFPAPERVHSVAVGGDMLLFSGVFEVVVPVIKPVVPGARATDGKSPRTKVVLRYQACDNSTCFPPKEVVEEG